MRAAALAMPLLAGLLVACSRLATPGTSVDPAQRGPYAVGETAGASSQGTRPVGRSSNLVLTAR